MTATLIPPTAKAAAAAAATAGAAAAAGAVTSETIELLHRRASVRAFAPQPVPASVLDEVLAAAVRAPTSFNLQAYSLVVIRDVDRRTRLSDLVDQPHVARAPVVVVVCADTARLYRLGERHGEPVGPQHEDLMLTAIIDGSLAGMCLALGAESLGLGTVMVGAVRNRPGEVARLLELPPGVMALFGVCLGWPADAPSGRPRLRVDLLAHEEHYDGDRAERALVADQSTLWRADGAVSGWDVRNWRRQIVRGLRRARERASRPTGSR